MRERERERERGEMLSFILKYSLAGKVGDWKNYFTVAQNEEIEEVLKERMKDSSFKFVYE